MRWWLKVAAAFAAGAATAGASYVTIISSFDPKITGGSMTWYAQSLEYDGTYLLVPAGPRLAKRLYPTGSLLSTVVIYPAAGRGTAYDGSYFYFDNDYLDYIYQIDPATGSTRSSFPCPPGATQATGLAFGAGSLWFTDYLNAQLWRLTTAGSVQSSVPLAISRPWGLAYDADTPGGPFIWCVNHPYQTAPQSYIYKLTTDGSIVDSAPWPVAGVGGCGLAFDGIYLWGINNYFGQPKIALQMLYLSDQGVEPTSVGRIKALYR